MDQSRRHLALLFPALAAASARAQSSALPSKAYNYDDLPVRNNGENRQRAVFKGETHTRYAVELHETELAPGMAPHPPHQHVHEEMVIIREGKLEVTISGRNATLGPGSVVFIASNEHHGWRNVGAARARYFVMALGRDTA